MNERMTVHIHLLVYCHHKGGECMLLDLWLRMRLAEGLRDGWRIVCVCVCLCVRGASGIHFEKQPKNIRESGVEFVVCGNTCARSARVDKRVDKKAMPHSVTSFSPESQNAYTF